LLFGKQVPAGKGYDSGNDALGLEESCRPEAVLDLAAGPDQHDVGCRAVVASWHEDVGAVTDPFGCKTARLRENGKILAAEQQRRRPVVVHGDPPRRRSLVGVRGADHT
jgi:hypothetical protein